MAGRCVQLRLLSHEVRFLQTIAEREDISVSKALGRIIDESATPAPVVERRRSPKQVSRNLWIDNERLAAVERLRARQGVSRSEVVRRILDAAMAGERAQPPMQLVVRG